jgi:hypothetical protein
MKINGGKNGGERFRARSAVIVPKGSDSVSATHPAKLFSDGEIGGRIHDPDRGAKWDRGELVAELTVDDDQYSGKRMHRRKPTSHMTRLLGDRELLRY